MKEFIICSAIHVNVIGVYKDQPEGITSGFVIQARRHSDCYKAIENILILICEQYRYKYIEFKANREGQGFITNTNRFVGREEGLKIAIEANQIRHGGTSIDKDNPILISEMLY